MKSQHPGAPLVSPEISVYVRASLWLSTAALIIMASGAHAQDLRSAEQQEEQLIIGFMRGLFAEVHIPDALAATKIWATELKGILGCQGHAEARVFDDIQSAMEALENKRVDLLVLISRQYLEVRDKAALDPYFVLGKGESIREESLLLVNRYSGLQTLEDLKGKNLLVLNNAQASLGRIWLETLLLEQGIPDIDSYFGRIDRTEKPSRTVIPVFFGQADACLIHRSGFETMCELNPQLKDHLRIIGVSSPLLPSLMCIRRDYPEHLKSGLVEALQDLHNEPRGRQILMLLKVDRIFPFQESYLHITKELLSKHATLKEQVQKKTMADRKSRRLP